MDMLEQGRLVAHGFAAGIDCPGPETGKVQENGRTINIRLDKGVEASIEVVEEAFAVSFMVDGNEHGPWWTRTDSGTRLALVLRTFYRNREKWRRYTPQPSEG